MIDVSGKVETERTAEAEAFVRLNEETLQRVSQGTVEKGNVLEVARVAGITAAKNTAHLLPFCHPIPLDWIAVQVEVEREGLRLRSSVKAVAKTGVEMEALVAVCSAALTVYDMLKPYQKDIRIEGIHLLKKTGGLKEFLPHFAPSLKAAVLVCSDRVASGVKEDRSGKFIVQFLNTYSIPVEAYHIVPDEKEVIRQTVQKWVEQGIPLVVTTGGTGVGPRDVTVEAVRDLIEKEMPGVAEAMRSYGQRRTPYAMISRSVAGFSGKTLILTLPGSFRGVKESLQAIFPGILHAFEVFFASEQAHQKREGL
ncbi:MAG: bifunctional molybdenum cofactor biosynthesis protein MoaC/MoaB [bacterium JZ-2024 1]